MKIALYNENLAEQQEITEHLALCGRELLRPVTVAAFDDYGDFCRAIRTKTFDLLVVAQSGTFSLEVMDTVKQDAPGVPVLWFSDLDFGVRSYQYGVTWFGRKPVGLPVLRRAMSRALSVRGQPISLSQSTV